MRGRIFKRAAAIGTAIALLLVGGVAVWKRKTFKAMAQNWAELKRGADEAEALKTSDDLLEYIAAHPDTVSIATWTVGAPSEGLLFNADSRRPVASLTRLPLLAALGREVQEGRLAVDELISREEWELWALPGVDGGAHAASVRELEQSDRLLNGQVSVRDLAWTMMRFGTLSAADVLMHRVGKQSLSRGLPPSEDAPVPFSGEFLAWNPSLGKDDVWSLSERLKSDAAFRQQQFKKLTEDGLDLPIAEQARLAHAQGRQGTARALAQWMETFHTQGPAWVRESLEWPMTEEPTRKLYEVLGTAQGTLPGIVASASYGKPRGDRPARVTAVLFEKLPTAVWLHLMRTLLHQELESRLLEDAAFAQKAKNRLETRGMSANQH